MLSFKGKCVICKQNLTVFAPGFVCYDCEKRFHGKCLEPPLDVEEMNNVVINMRHWMCEPCKAAKGKELIDMIRPDKEAKEIKKKIEAINEIRDLLTSIDVTVDDTLNECDKLTEKAKALQFKNLELRLRIINFNKNKMPITAKLSEKARKGSIIATKVNKTGELKDEETMTKEEIIKEIKKETFKNQLKTDEKLMVYLQDSLSNLSEGWLVQVVLIFLLLLYTLLGALVFLLIEGWYENKLLHDIYVQRIAVIQKVAEKHNSLPGTATATTKSQEELQSYYDFLWDYYTINAKLLEPGDKSNWTFLTAIFFCGITYTTIGFGFFVPVTTIGKVFTMIYILFGLPLFLILMATLGTSLFNLLQIQWNWMKTIFSSQCCKKQNEPLSTNETAQKDVKKKDVPVLLVILVEILFLIVGAWIFMTIEVWSFQESFYFVFTSMTVGFGDYVPSDIRYLMASFSYIIIGLALTSMVISTITVKVVSSFEKATHKLSEGIEFYLHDQFMNESTGEETK